jgi:hypothetical protein
MCYEHFIKTSVGKMVFVHNSLVDKFPSIVDWKNRTRYLVVVKRLDLLGPRGCQFFHVLQRFVLPIN